MQTCRTTETFTGISEACFDIKSTFSLISQLMNRMLLWSNQAAVKEVVMLLR